MTGAVILSSTDNLMIQTGPSTSSNLESSGQPASDASSNSSTATYQCLGYGCGYYWLRHVTDDPDRQGCKHVATSDPPTASTRILKQAVARGSAYVYLQGCPADKGCTLVLRGETRKVLTEIKKVLKFSVMLAYHLKLEVAYYNDRFAVFPYSVVANDNMALLDEHDDSDEEEEKELVKSAFANESKDTGSLNAFSNENSRSGSVGDEDDLDSVKPSRKLLEQQERYKLSISMDVDIKMPYLKEVVGVDALRQQSMYHLNSKLSHTNPEEYQSLLVTSLLMTKKNTQRSRAEIKCLKFYAPDQDLPFGQFLIESCFFYPTKSKLASGGGGGGQGAAANSSRESMHGGGPGSATAATNNALKETMLSHTLTFAHRSGRIDISVSACTYIQPANVIGSQSNLAASAVDGNVPAVDPFHLPIVMASFCKSCNLIVTPLTTMSNETWKMSFGKFLEISFYNKTARCRSGGCKHILHGNHVQYFCCDGYLAKFEFVPLHSYSLRVRYNLPHPTNVLNLSTFKSMYCFSILCVKMMDEFMRICMNLELEVKDLLGDNRLHADTYHALLSDLDTVKADMEALELALTMETERLCKLLKITPKVDSVDILYDRASLKRRTLVNDSKQSIVSPTDHNYDSDIKAAMDEVDELIVLKNLPIEAADVSCCFSFRVNFI